MQVWCELFANQVGRDADLDLLVGKMRGMRSRREFFSLG